MKPRKVTGFFALLSPEQQAAVLAYTGDDEFRRASVQSSAEPADAKGTLGHTSGN